MSLVFFSSLLKIHIGCIQAATGSVAATVAAVTTIITTAAATAAIA